MYALMWYSIWVTLLYKFDIRLKLFSRTNLILGLKWFSRSNLKLDLNGFTREVIMYARIAEHIAPPDFHKYKGFLTPYGNQI